MHKKHSFTRKEIALLLDLITLTTKQIDPDTMRKWGVTESKLRQMYFKLYRIL